MIFDTKPTQSFVVYHFLLIGFPVLIWLFADAAIETYRYWKYGVEKSAMVELEGSLFTKRVPYQLRTNETYSVLVIPDAPKDFVIGNNKSSLYQLFENIVGNGLIQIYYVTTYIFIFIFAPPFYVGLLIHRREYLYRGKFWKKK